MQYPMQEFELSKELCETLIHYFELFEILFRAKYIVSTSIDNIDKTEDGKPAR